MAGLEILLYFDDAFVPDDFLHLYDAFVCDDLLHLYFHFLVHNFLNRNLFGDRLFYNLLNGYLVVPRTCAYISVCEDASQRCIRRGLCCYLDRDFFDDDLLHWHRCEGA